MTLPPALLPWEPELEAFPPDLVLSLAPWLPRLAMAFGPLRTTPRFGIGEPDGLSGLSRRGSYERLLLSEWALAEALPDEFLRRAAMKEHVFLELARHEPAGSTRSLVLLDAGPEQLGAPRIFHLAALLVLARRAKEAHAELRWAVLQSEDEPWADVNEHSILALLAARSPREANAADLERWAEGLFLRADRRCDDLWLIGGQRTLRLGERHRPSSVWVQESNERRPQRLYARIQPQGLPERSLELPLPEPNAAVRLLRNPFEVPKAPPARAAPPLLAATAPLFDPSGRRFFFRSDGGVTMFSVPSSPTTPIPRSFGARGGTVVGVGTHRGEVILATHHEDQLSLLRYTAKGRFGSPARRVLGPFKEAHVFWPPGRDSPLAALIPHGNHFLTVDGAGRLYRLHDKDDAPPELLSWGAMALMRTQGVPVAVLDQAPQSRCLLAEVPQEGRFGGRRLIVKYIDGRWIMAAELESTTDFVVFAAPRTPDFHFGSTAYSLRPGTWRLNCGYTVFDVDVPTDWRVVGIAAGPQRPPGLVALSGDNTQFRIYTKSGFEAAGVEPHPIRAAGCAGNTLVHLDTTGQLVIRALSPPRVLARHLLEGQ